MIRFLLDAPYSVISGAGDLAPITSGIPAYIRYRGKEVIVLLQRNVFEDPEGHRYTNVFAVAPDGGDDDFIMKVIEYAERKTGRRNVRAFVGESLLGE